MTHTPTPWSWDEVGDLVIRGTKTKVEQSIPTATRIIACVNFFHGQNIPTERIPEGGIGDLIDLLEDVAYKAGTFNREPLKHAENVINEHSERALALLTKLGVEP